MINYISILIRTKSLEWNTNDINNGSVLNSFYLIEQDWKVVPEPQQFKSQKKQSLQDMEKMDFNNLLSLEATVQQK